MSYRDIIYEKSSGIARITFSRPEVLNALDVESRKEILDALEDAERDDAVRVIVLTGEGEKAFCAGADVRIFKDMKAIDAAEYVKLAKSVPEKIEKLPKPVIAAVNGYALGGGCEIAMACDLIVAAESARFGQTEINLGIIPGAGGTQRLPRLIGLKKAAELMFTGEQIDARTAHQLGLVNQVVPAEGLAKAVDDLAGRLLTKSPLILGLIKNAIHATTGTHLSTGLDYESRLFALTFTSEDTKEGINAFLEKRKPVFKGR